MGYAAVRISDEKVFKGQCLPHSAQAPEIVVVTVALENMPTDETESIFTDSEWVLRAIIDWMPQWQKRGMKSADSKYIAHAEKLVIVDPFTKWVGGNPHKK
nr:ribonuclease H-like [Chrysemys picta bellii]